MEIACTENAMNTSNHVGSNRMEKKRVA